MLGPVFPRGERVDVLVYGLLAAEWRERRGTEETTEG
jgi:hypothetical protein